MKKILIVITTGFVPHGGLATVMLNYYSAMNKEKMQIDFASTNNPDKSLLDLLRHNGSRYFNLGKRNKSLFSYLQMLKHILKTEHYNVIHVNGNSSTMGLELSIAKKIGVPVRIAHSHTTQSDHPLINNFLYKKFNSSYTIAISCSKAAGNWLFNDKFLVLNNAIDTNKFSYSESVRSKYRNALGVEDNIVIGTIGKINAAKNHIFLIKIFNEILKKKPNARLLIVGDGESRAKIESEIMRLNLENKVLLLGTRTDNAQLLQCMDVFIFPSKFEGLGLALIEAQSTGLPCFASNYVPKEAGITENVVFLELEKGPLYWTEKILSFHNNKSRSERCSIAKEKIEKNGYDIKNEVDRLRSIYLNGIGDDYSAKN